MVYYFILVIIALWGFVVTLTKAIRFRHEGGQAYAFLAMFFIIMVLVLSIKTIPSVYADQKLESAITDLMYQEFGVQDAEYIISKEGNQSEGFIYEINAGEQQYEILIKDRKILSYILKEQ